MKRYYSVYRCLRHGFMPPFLEKRLYGRIHYEGEQTYWQHLGGMLDLAFRLAFFLPIPTSDRDFYI